MKYKNGEEFLNKLYSNMHMEDVVMHTAEKSDSPEEKISKYMNRLDRVHNIAKGDRHKMELLKKFYYDKYVIKELPENYVELQKKIAREEGRGDIYVTNDMNEELLLNIQEDQKKSLDSWIDYLTSDDALYPMWFKNYAFQGMLKLGQFNKEKSEFGKRTSTTTSPYIELNMETLALVYDTLSNEIGKDELTDEQVKALENGESFKKLYTYYLTKQNYIGSNQGIDGIWVKYNQGGDYKKLCDSLQGKNTGWCTAGEETAKTQLKMGDFHVYYTKNNDGEYTEPRIAIRMEGNKIAEVRGVSANQNLEGNMVDIAEKKLDEFPDKDVYKKKVQDMKQLTEIEKKQNSGDELSIDELSFLYEINDKIIGFGYKKDPRIKEIKESRNPKVDLSKIFNCSPSQIAKNLYEIERNRDISYIACLNSIAMSSNDLPSYLRSIIYIGGNAYFDSLKTAKGLEKLQSIGGDAYFYELKTAQGLKKLRSIGGNAEFDALKTAKGLEKLHTIGGHGYFNSLKDAQGLENLQSIGGNAEFNSLESASGLENLQNIGLDAYFHFLKNARGLKKLQSIGKNAYFNSLETAQGLKKLQNIGWDAGFNSLENADDLGNLQRIGGTAHFNSLKTTKGLENLQSIGWDAEFKSLENAQGLGNLQSIGENAYFNSLKYARGLEKLQSIGGNAYFYSLKNARGLGNLQSIGENAYFNSLENAEDLGNLQSIGWNAYFYSLGRAEGSGNSKNKDEILDYIKSHKELTKMTENTNIEEQTNGVHK